MWPSETISERICKRLEEIVLASTISTRDRVIDFAIVTQERDTNTNPILFQEGHLGMVAWSVDSVYQYVCSKIFPLRKSLERGTTLLQDRQNLNCWLIAAILINPHVTTFWNMRRQLALQGTVDFSTELELSRIVLTRSFKSSDTFTYRRWVLKRLVLDESVVLEAAKTVLSGELDLCDKVLDLAADNYHCWIHRQCCMFTFNIPNVIENTLVEEFKCIDFWMQRHYKISNGYHYKQFLMKFVQQNNYYGCLPQATISVSNNSINLPSNVSTSTALELANLNIANFWEQLGNNEFVDCSDAFITWVRALWRDLSNENFEDKRFYMHENFWLHRRCLLFMLLASVYVNLGGNIFARKVYVKSNLIDSNILLTVCKRNYEMNEQIFDNSTHSLIITSSFYKALINAEKNLVKNFTFPSNLQLTQRHCSWLNYFLRFDVKLTSEF